MELRTTHGYNLYDISSMLQKAIRRADVTELLHIGKRTTSRLLRSLTDDGELVLLRPSQRYALPDSKCNNDTIG